ncbi:DUF2382 domain-containing protein [Saccharomonospora piscinae]|uniref:DUF2382 domain-containing protein n=1 Tax=Saccharomonospora piscinae TaxID=687388 RepID=UPI000467295D|nr:PRC and DUF2382 domain-containing protein [Saccharomonospora piscinae]
MATPLRPEELVDNAVVDADGRKIGKVGTVYLSDESRQPEWVTVRTGLFGMKESFVPLQGAHMEADGVHVSVSKDQVSDAPRTDTDTDLTGTESAELYRHYDLPAPRAAMPEEHGGTARDTGMREGVEPRGEPEPRPGMAGAAGAGTAGAAGTAGTPGTTGPAEGEPMVRSEEHLHARTEDVETGRVRLRKYVVTEEEQVTVPVSHEEVRLEREPVGEAERGEGGRIGEEEQEVTLHRERAKVTKETEPVEKVRLGKERVTEQETVSGEVRKERFDVEQDTTETGEGRRRET